jgi:hypothetical protein
VWEPQFVGQKFCGCRVKLGLQGAVLQPSTWGYDALCRYTGSELKQRTSSPCACRTHSLLGLFIPQEHLTVLTDNLIRYILLPYFSRTSWLSLALFSFPYTFLNRHILKKKTNRIFDQSGESGHTYNIELAAI